MKLKKISLAGVVLTWLPLAAAAQPMTMDLTAGNMLAQTHSHALIMGVTGTFRQLSGKLDFDPAAKTCHIDVTLVVESLALPNALIRSQTMSKAFLDPAEYPTQHYVGDCAAGRLQGQLTMRGQTHPFDMAVSYTSANGQITAIHTEGVLNRYDWGLNGLTMTVGKMIRVTNDISLNGQPPKPES
ncbi:YceI family protein [Acidocella sp.]|jgi:polyisoprenoid-binding protein YceI|uniref:YceI family protein n=1 Tax=Acidocella sp. TaxID=50710 RepID=UPI002F412C1C